MRQIPASIRKRLAEGELMPAIAQNSKDKKVLMLAWMNTEALEKTLASGYATYWSRSRKEIWKKGETSGNLQEIKEIRYDCDSDSILLIVDQIGPSCHTGEDSCFHNSFEDGK